MNKISLALSWYVTLVCTLTFSLLLLIYISSTHQSPTKIPAHYQLYKALPDLGLSTVDQDVSINKGDARAVIIKNFFIEQGAPLAAYADKFVEIADKYNLDFRLLPAISMQESNGGKKIPDNSYNPFGYGIYGSQILRFNSFDEAIEKVGAGLRKNYLDLGLKNPYQIMTKYTPPSLEKGGSWAIGVGTFMEELR